MATEQVNKPMAANIDQMVEFAHDGIVSKTVLDAPFGKVVLMCMASGQSLSEHTASQPALVHILQGQGIFQLGGEDHDAKPGSWFYMPAHLPHAVRSDENLVFLLTLFRQE